VTSQVATLEREYMEVAAAAAVTVPLLSFSLSLSHTRNTHAVRSSLTRAVGKQLCCRPGTVVQLLWPPVNPALAGENSAI
jgi:hypothetical protein